MPVEFPAVPSLCSYFSYEEFARTLTADLVEACKPFGFDVVLATSAQQIPWADATIRCYVHDVRQYSIPFWQQIFKWLVPFVGYFYYPASFTLSGVIQTPHHPTMPFQATRRFHPGGLGEKSAMRNGIRAEAIRIIGMTAKTLDVNSPLSPNSFFWPYVLLAPMLTVACGALVAHLVLQGLAMRTVALTPDAKYFQIFVATFLVVLAACLSIVLAPGWVYADRRAAFAYRWISSPSSLTLRVFIFICALCASFISALTLVVVLGNT